MNIYPSCGIRAKVGFSPTTPQRDAGILTDPEQINKQTSQVIHQRFNYLYSY